MTIYVQEDGRQMWLLVDKNDVGVTNNYLNLPSKIMRIQLSKLIALCQKETPFLFFNPPCSFCLESHLAGSRCSWFFKFLRF